MRRPVNAGSLAGILAAGIALGAAPVRADCRWQGADASIASVSSRWKEFDAAGRTLVRERGTLTRTEASASWQCATATLQGALSHAVGTRSYEGETNRQAPLSTATHARADEFAFVAWVPVAAQWDLGGQFRYQDGLRDIASTPTVLGYPERFAYWQAAAGARFHAELPPGLSLVLSGWAGGGPGGRLQARLPQADKLTLPLGPSQLAQIRLELSPSPVEPRAWAWQIHAAVTRDLLRAGSVREVTRNGLLVGGASQPRTLQQQASLGVALTYRLQ